MQSNGSPRPAPTATLGCRKTVRPARISVVGGRLAWSATIALVVAGPFAWGQLGFRDLPVSMKGGPAASLALPLVAAVYASIGALILERRGCCVVGGLFMAVGFTLATVLPVDVLVAASHDVMRPVATSTLLVAWGVSTMSLPLVATLLLLIPILFPTGRPISRRWWAGVAAGIAGGILLAAAGAVCPFGLMWYPSLRNPFGVRGIEPLLLAMSVAGVALVLAAILAGVASIVVRYRRADGVLRAQLRWATAGAVLTGLTASPALLIRYLPGPTGVAGGEAFITLAILGQVFAPLTVGVAMLRHHLYDIDLLIDRSLVYLPLIGLLGGLYTASVVLVQRIFVAITGDTSDAVIVVSSLLIAWVFTPLRKYLEGAVERRLHAGGSTPTDVAPAVGLASEMSAFQAELHSVASRISNLEARKRDGVDRRTARIRRPAPKRRRAYAAPQRA